MPTRVVRALGLLVTIVVLGAGWYFLAPPQLGGKTSYAVTFGVSMEPHFKGGDLVVLRARPTYAVGDVVAYRSHDLHRSVLHRIIAARDGHFTFKGDNNGFVDPEQPSAADLVGSEWLRVPGAGTWLASLHSPRNAAVAAFLIVLLLVLGGSGTVVVHRRHRRRAPGRTERKPRRPASGAAPSAGFVVAATGAGALVAAAVLGALAFTRPLERSLVWANLYVQRGTFSYAATVDRGAAYQQTRLVSGEPVYLRLVHRLPVTFRYRLETAKTGSLGGSISLGAVVRDDKGWRHAIELAPSRDFAGPRATARGMLDLQRIERVIERFERETGAHNTLYHVSLAAKVAVRGTVAARPISTSFAPTLQFDLDPLQLAVSTGGADPGTPSNSFTQSAGGAGTRVETSTLHGLGRAITVARARRLATLLGLVGLGLAALGGALMLLGRRGHEVTAIRRRYEDWIVDIAPGERPTSAERRVASMDALARLAERYDRLILHEHREDGDAFLVEDDGVAYAYVVRTWDRPLVVAR